MEDNAKMGSLLLEKFVNEEIMTKSEFQMSLDRMMDRHEAKITANINAKFQTKEDFQLSIDRIMDKHEVRIDAKFDLFETKLHNMSEHFDRQFLKIDARYNWIIGLILTSTIGIVGLVSKFMSMIPH